MSETYLRTSSTLDFPVCREDQGVKLKSASIYSRDVGICSLLSDTVLHIARFASTCSIITM